MGQGQQPGQLEGWMSRSFPELCAHGTAGKPDLQPGKEGEDGVDTG